MPKPLPVEPSPLERAVADLTTAFRANDEEAAIKAAGALLIAGLGALERIADALEQRNTDNL